MDMKKIIRTMSILMGVTLSFCLSLAGNLTSGHFTPIGFLASFAVSTVISLIIGFLVPIKKLGDGASRALKLKERSIPARLVESLVSDLIYTPVITLAMIALARKLTMVMSRGNASLPPFMIMFLKSLIISLAVGYVLIFFLTPVYLKLVLKKNGISGAPSGRPEE